MRSGRPLEHRMLVGSQESIWLLRNVKQGRRRKKRRTSQAREQARWNRENKLQCGDFGTSAGCRNWHGNDGVSFQGRKAHVHKTLISASKVHSEGRVAVLDSNVGQIIPKNNTLARKIQQLVQEEIVRELFAIRWYLENGTYIGYTKIQQQRSTRRNL